MNQDEFIELMKKLEKDNKDLYKRGLLDGFICTISGIIIAGIIVAVLVSKGII